MIKYEKNMEKIMKRRKHAKKQGKILKKEGNKNY